MAINEMHDFIVWLKNQGQGGYHPPEEIVRALNAGSDDKFLQEAPQFERNEIISSNLRNFKKSSSVALTSGLGDIPADYSYITNAGTSGDLPVDIVPEGEWLSRINDPIAVPTTTRPVCTVREQVEVRPISLPSIKIYYLRRPATMVMNFTEDGEGNVTYDPTGSVDCDWPAGHPQTDLIRRACVYLGIPLRDDLLMKLESFKKATEAQ